MFAFRLLEKLINLFRSFIWAYPDTLFFSRSSLVNALSFYYQKLRPFSHFAFGILIFFLGAGILIFDQELLIWANEDIYIEGVIVGVDDSGKLLNIARVNPLVPSSVQLEKDLSNLIYESLVEVDQNAEVEKVLIDSFELIKRNNHYRFTLKDNIFWHDGVQMTSKDVEATFYLLRRLNSSADTSSNYSNVLANQFDDIVILDDFRFELKLKKDDSVLPTYWESINFKILPAHYISNLDSYTIFNNVKGINLQPIGTGPYKNLEISPTNIKLKRNLDFHRGVPNIASFVFRLLEDETQALKALESLEIHALAGLSSEGLQRASHISVYKKILSNVVYNQYWAIYFELSGESEQVYKSQEVRQALDYAIDREKIIEAIAGQGAQAWGTIPKTSFAFNSDLLGETYDPNHAKKILESNGWLLNTDTRIREKEGKSLSMSMVYVDNVDRNIVASSIQEDLKAVGVELILIPETIRTVNDRHILLRDFEMLLYGQTTFIDPDRYELFHSSQIGFPGAGGEDTSTGLNLSGYISSKEAVEIADQELTRVPKVDRLLEDGRSYLEQSKRKESYFEFQEVIKEEVPVIFLYHPKYTYVVNQRLNMPAMSGINSIEDRFSNVNEWSIL
jgi:peptide/nickel transport system substrate-binding protein